MVRLPSVGMVVWNEFIHDARVINEARSLARNGYNVRVVALHNPIKTVQVQKYERRFSVVRVWRSLRPSKYIKETHRKSMPLPLRRRKGSWRSVPFLRRSVKAAAYVVTHVRILLLLVRMRPKIIHAHDFNVLITCWIASLLVKSRLVYDAHETSTSREGYRRISQYVALIERKLCRKVDAMITTTDTRAKYFARLYGIERPIVLQNRPRYQPYQQSNFLREILSLNSTWPIVIYQGGIQQGRGLERLIKAATYVKDTYFVLVGSGRKKDEIRALVDTLELSSRVKLIDAVPLEELPLYTASATIGVQPIENTCFNHFSTDSNKLFEYIQARLAIVATGFPEIRKVVDDFDVGITVNESGVSCLSDALSQLATNKVLLSQYRDNAEMASHSLTWEAQEQSLLDVYDSITRKIS